MLCLSPILNLNLKAVPRLALLRPGDIPKDIVNSSVSATGGMLNLDVVVWVRVSIDFEVLMSRSSILEKPGSKVVQTLHIRKDEAAPYDIVHSAQFHSGLSGKLVKDSSPSFQSLCESDFSIFAFCAQRSLPIVEHLVVRLPPVFNNFDIV